MCRVSVKQCVIFGILLFKIKQFQFMRYTGSFQLVLVFCIVRS